MKLKNEFIVHQSGEESLLVPTGNAGFSGIVRGNRTLGVMLELLQEETTETALIAALRERFDAADDASAAAIASDVQKLLGELRAINALAE